MPVAPLVSKVWPRPRTWHRNGERLERRIAAPANRRSESAIRSYVIGDYRPQRRLASQSDARIGRRGVSGALRLKGAMRRRRRLLCALCKRKRSSHSLILSLGARLAYSCRASVDMASRAPCADRIILYTIRRRSRAFSHNWLIVFTFLSYYMCTGVFVCVNECVRMCVGRKWKRGLWHVLLCTVYRRCSIFFRFVFCEMRCIDTPGIVMNIKLL